MYADQQAMIDRYGEDAVYIAADRDGDDSLDSEAIALALQDATDEINVHIGSRYSLPLPEVPALLKKLCVDMAFYHLSAANGYTDEKRKRYEDAISLLKRIGDGRASLGLEQPAPTSTGGAEFITSPRRFGRKGMGRLT